MKNLLLALLLFALVDLQTIAQTRPSNKRKPVKPTYVLEPQVDPSNWKEFISGEGRFSIVAPGVLEYATHDLSTPLGPVKLHRFLLFADAEYSVTFCDYSVRLEGTEREKVFLDAVRDSGVKGINGRLVADQESSFNGHPGRLYKVEYETDFKYLLTSKTILVGNRMYMVMTTYRRDALPKVVRDYEQWAERFRESFKLVSKVSAS